jgi:hypothetical protein
LRRSALRVKVFLLWQVGDLPGDAVRTAGNQPAEARETSGG